MHANDKSRPDSKKHILFGVGMLHQKQHKYGEFFLLSESNAAIIDP